MNFRFKKLINEKSVSVFFGCAVLFHILSSIEKIEPLSVRIGITIVFGFFAFFVLFPFWLKLVYIVTKITDHCRRNFAQK